MLKEEEIDLLRSFRYINQEMKIFAGGHLTKTGPNVDGLSCFSYDNNRNFSIKFIEPRVTDGEHRFFVILRSRAPYPGSEWKVNREFFTYGLDECFKEVIKFIDISSFRNDRIETLGI
jgi:hypothetical protein